MPSRTSLLVVLSLLVTACGQGPQAGLLPRAEAASSASRQDRCLSPTFFVRGREAEGDLLPLKSARADVSISGVIASVRVGQVYRNEGRRTLEATYVFPASTRGQGKAGSFRFFQVNRSSGRWESVRTAF